MLRFSGAEKDAIDDEVDKLLNMHVIEPVYHCAGEYISSIFVRPKKDGTPRMILNLKDLNEFVVYHHFKMDTLESAIKLMKPNCWMASVDLKHAYFSVPMNRAFRKYLRFIWNGKLFQFTCLPQGLKSAPRLFTKITKPIYATLRSMGHIVLGYIDDSYLQAESKELCVKLIHDTIDLFVSLGFIVNIPKSVTDPSHELEFLGFILNSTNMTVRLTVVRIERVISACVKLRNKNTDSIRNVAQVIGLMVSSFPGVEYGQLFYRSLEIQKIKALNESRGDFDQMMPVTDEMKSDMTWWIENLSSQKRDVTKADADIVLNSDASLEGWGANYIDRKIGSRWNEEERSPISIV